MKKVLVIKNEVAELERLAIFIEQVAEESNLDPETTMNLNLALEEVVSNVILYAYPLDVGTLVFTITDKGEEFDPTKVEEADVTLDAEDRQIGGLGIFIVRNIMNEVTYQRLEGKNILTLKKNI